MHSACCDGVTGDSSVVRIWCDISFVFSAGTLAVIMIRQSRGFGVHRSGPDFNVEGQMSEGAHGRDR